MKKNLVYTNHPCYVEDYYTEQYYKEYCEDYEYDGTYEEWKDMMVELDWEALRSDLGCHYRGYQCRIEGTLGLWNGTPTIEPVLCEDIMSAIWKCINNMDYITLRCDKNHIYLECVHHDGTNNFKLTLLNKYKWDERNCEWKYKMIKGIDEYLGGI